MTYEEGGSSEAVYKQEINEEELKPILSEVEILMNFVKSREDEDKFSPIYVVPSRLREVNPSSFTPRVVSIGPLHKGRANLKLMEDKKAIYLNEFLSEVGSPNKTLAKCVKKVSDSITKIKRYYFGQSFDPQKYTDEELARMMVTDACLILQFINNLLFRSDNNIFFENRLRSRYVAMDLVLLENQIPFFVLEDIHNLTFKTLESKPDLITMLHDLLERVNPFYEKLKKSKVEINPSDKKPRYHILGLLHEFYQPESSKPPPIEQIPAAHHSAVELHKVGVRFRPNQNMNWIMDMEFEQSSHKPTLRVPEVLIDNFFEVVMRNLIAYEQYSFKVRNYVTSYAMAMDILVATPADIGKLVESDVIRNNLGSNEKASYMISSICKDVTFHDFYHIESWNKTKKIL